MKVFDWSVGVDRARGTNLRGTDISMGTGKPQDWRPAKRKRRYGGVHLQLVCLAYIGRFNIKNSYVKDIQST